MLALVWPTAIPLIQLNALVGRNPKPLGPG
jgi:hypothetical protein